MTAENSRADALTPCAHADDPKACYRVRCQLGGKCVDDDMSPRQPAPSPADERAAFEAWLKRPHPNNWNDCNHPLEVGERQAARFGWKAGIAYARAASASATEDR